MKTTIGFTGDIAFSEYTQELYKTPQKIDKNIYEFLNKNDYNVLNFESPITDITYTTKGALAHKSDLKSLNFIKDNIKNPILSIANNHMLDYGLRGLLDTIKTLKKEKVKYIGAGKNINDAINYVILGKDIKVGIISFQYKSSLMADKDNPGTAHEKHQKIIKEKIKELKNICDWIVIVYHGGEEFSNSPMPYTKRKIKKFLNWGADIVVAHHPHTIQGYEKINNKLVFYSLGNFIFDTDFQRAQSGTDKGVAISIEFSKDSYRFDYIIIKNTREENKIIKEENDLNFKDIKKTWKKEWKKEAGRLNQIKENKTELKEYRKKYIINDLRIDKADIKEMIPFNDLIKKYKFDGINDPVVFEGKNIIVRIFNKIIRKLKNANYSRRIYMLLAKILKW